MSTTFVAGTRSVVIVALIASAALGVSACSEFLPGRITAGSAPYTDGSGVKTTVQRSIGGFHAISAAMGVTVVLHAGTPGVASVTADDNLLAQIVTEVRDGTLYVDVTGGIRSTNVPRVELATAELQRVSASTGATIEAASLSGSALSVEASTGGTLRAGGSADTLRVTSSTGGTADVRNVQARHVEADVSTGATAHVYPTESVTGTCNGGATLLIRGRPAENSVSVDEGSTIRDGQ